MTTIKLCTDIEQGKTLEKFLSYESADMFWKNGVSDEYIQCFTPFVINETGTNVNFEYDVPCWSLAALLGILPKIHGLRPILDLEECSIIYSGIDIYITASNLIDACVEMIVKLHEQKII